MNGSAFDRTGRIAPGYRFDALVIGGTEDDMRPLPTEERLERFCYDGDDRNITARYLNGKPVDPDEVYERLMKVEV